MRVIMFIYRYFLIAFVTKFSLCLCKEIVFFISCLSRNLGPDLRGRSMCWWSPWRSEERTRFIAVWLEESGCFAVVPSHGTGVWKISEKEAKLNNTLPGTSEITGWKQTLLLYFVWRLSGYSFLLLLFSFIFLLSEFSESLCFPCKVVPSSHTRAYTHVQALVIGLLWNAEVPELHHSLSEGQKDKKILRISASSFASISVSPFVVPGKNLTKQYVSAHGHYYLRRH